MAKQRFIFVSHSYKDAELHHQLVGELRKRPRFAFQDLSVPDITLIQEKNVKAAIRKRISECDVMLVFARPIATKSQMIQFELEAAKKLGKPIIAIRPAGDKRISTVVRRAADVLIDWDVEDIIKQIRTPGAKTKPQAEPDVVDDAANAEPPSRGFAAMLRKAISFLPHTPTAGKPPLAAPSPSKASGARR
jgi:MTH538 TIR-like domain (DUF1863)